MVSFSLLRLTKTIVFFSSFFSSMKSMNIFLLFHLLYFCPLMMKDKMTSPALAISANCDSCLTLVITIMSANSTRTPRLPFPTLWVIFLNSSIVDIFSSPEFVVIGFSFAGDSCVDGTSVFFSLSERCWYVLESGLGTCVDTDTEVCVTPCDCSEFRED